MAQTLHPQSEMHTPKTRKLAACFLLLATFYGATAVGDLREADSDVKGSISAVRERTRDVFHETGITQTGSSTQKSGKEQTLNGTKGHMDIEVQLKQAGNNQTHVTIYAKESEFKWNKDYAQALLSKIIQHG